MNDQKVRALVAELLESSPPPPGFDELTRRRTSFRPSRRRTVRIAAGLVVAAAITGGVVLTVQRPSHRQELHTNPPTTAPAKRGPTTVAPAPSAPSYVQLTDPPPLRLSAGSHTVVVTTILGCWFTEPPNGSGSGRCADGATIGSVPFRFHLDMSPGTHVLLTSPIPGKVQASTAAMPTRPTNPRSFPGPLTKTAPVIVRQTSQTSWDITVPADTRPRALLINLRAATTVRGTKVSGDGNYSLELRPTKP